MKWFFPGEKWGRRLRLNEHIGLFRRKRRMFLVEVVIIVIVVIKPRLNCCRVGKSWC